MVEQFLPDLTQPLQAKCGKILNLKALSDQLMTFQDKLLPPDREDLLENHDLLEQEGSGGEGPGLALWSLVYLSVHAGKDPPAAKESSPS